jgi:hypothetical protein
MHTAPTTRINFRVSPSFIFTPANPSLLEVRREYLTLVSRHLCLYLDGIDTLSPGIDPLSPGIDPLRPEKAHRLCSSLHCWPQIPAKDADMKAPTSAESILPDFFLFRFSLIALYSCSCARSADDASAPARKGSTTS